jgi:hypothetical protein
MALVTFDIFRESDVLVVPTNSSLTSTESNSTGS